MPADDDNRLLPFSLPSVCRTKVTSAFDGGLISSDGGVWLLAGADQRLGLVDTLAAIIPDYRDQTQITHTMSDILRARILAIACGYPGADDLDHLRNSPDCTGSPLATRSRCTRRSCRKFGPAAPRRMLVGIARARAEYPRVPLMDEPRAAEIDRTQGISLAQQRPHNGGHR